MEERKRKFRNATMFVLAFACLVLVLFYITFSWYGEKDEKNNSMVVASLDVTVTSGIDKFKDLVLEPNKLYDNMDTVIVGKANTTDFYIKVKFETSVKINEQNILTPIVYEENPDKISWIYNEEDGWYYYVGYCNDSKPVKFNTGFQMTNEINNALKGEPVMIKLTVDSIQRHYKAYETDEKWKTAPAQWKTAIAEFDIEN